MRLTCLHECGGVSYCWPKDRNGKSSSPPLWRCFVRIYRSESICVQTLHVSEGVSNPDALRGLYLDFLHRGGGVSNPDSLRGIYLDLLHQGGGVSNPDSLRGLYLDFLHQGGGVSKTTLDTGYLIPSSPRVWRCFSL